MAVIFSLLFFVAANNNYVVKVIIKLEMQSEYQLEYCLR